MARKISCFVSYSAVDGNDRNVQFLLKYLSERLDGKVNFKVYSDLRSGSDLQIYMRKDLLESEAVLALFTPDYKFKVDNSISSGVLTEHLHIVDRIEGRITTPPLLFIPVLWIGGTFEAATPQFYLGRNFARNFQQFRAYGASGEAYLPDRIAHQLRPEIDRVVADLLSRWEEADPTYESTKIDIENAILLNSTNLPQELDSEGGKPEHRIHNVFFPKSERGSMTIEEFSAHFFVKTAAFRAIGLHHKMAFSGRKGSGKTTLLKVYKYLNKAQYFNPIDVEVNDWNLHYLLEDLTFRPAEGDLSYTAEESKIFDFIWPTFLALCMVRSICTSRMGYVPEKLIPNPEYAAQFKNSIGRYESLFQLSIGIVRDFMSSCISLASSKTEYEFKADLLRLLNVNACTEYLLGPRWHQLVEAARKDSKKRRFLFCLDRFDTEIQKYRKDLKDQNMPENERNRRERREVFWIQGLVELIDNLRSPDQYALNQGFYKTIGPMIDFCVPLPKDRLYEVQLRRRDSIISDIKDEISWQPYELLTMLRKRLQAIWKISDDMFDKPRHLGAKQRFDEMIGKCGRRMPKTAEIRMNDTVFSLDLFLNVLRHTFFRPRDVIIFYARIALGVELAHRRGQRVTTAALSRMISEQTFKIVENEFLGEFSDTFKNIEEVLNIFRGSPQLLNLDDLSIKLENVKFKIYAEDDIVELGSKIRFLYELGFLGVCSEDAQLGGISRDDYDFYFFNPRIAQNLEEDSILQSLKFAIHPVFIEYLTLRLNAKTPVMMFTWEKVDELDDFV